MRSLSFEAANLLDGELVGEPVRLDVLKPGKHQSSVRLRPKSESIFLASESAETTIVYGERQ